MAAGSLAAVSLATILSLAVPRFASPAELRLTFQNGRVTLFARDVSVRDVLAEWERVGGTRIVNRDAAPEVSLTLDLGDVPEIRALAIILQQAAGYFASERTTAADTSSRFTRIVIMPGAERLDAGSLQAAGAQAAVAATGAAVARPQYRQASMPDGRVISVVEQPARPAEAPVEREEEWIQPPPVEASVNMGMVVPAGVAPAPAGMAPAPAVADQAPNPKPAARAPGETTRIPGRASPTAPVTAAIPGTYIPGPKAEPPPYVPGGGIPPPPPIKPPGI